MKLVTALVLVAGLAVGGQAWAQDTASGDEPRPATASFWGDTGLWFVPTGEVLPTRGWSFSLYRTELDFNQGFSDVSYWPATFGVGVGNRLEVFGSLHTVTSIDRDTRPLFLGDTETTDGGVLNEYPFVNENFTGEDLGDLYVGGKVNLLSQRRNQPLALALRGTVKLPTADSDGGAGSGEFDYYTDGIISRQLNSNVEISGFTGLAFRGDPVGISLSDSLRWGVGAGFGATAGIRLTTELHGEVPFDDEIVATSARVTGVDGSVSPIITTLDSRMNAAFGVTWLTGTGLSLGVGLNYRFGLDQRSDVSASYGDVSGDAWGIQLRVGFHPGVRLYAPPAPPIPTPMREEPAPAPTPVAAAAPPPPPANRRPTIKAMCNPCTVEVGQTATIRAESQDPDGDMMSYKWGTNAGTVGDTRSAATTWKAETAPGSVMLTVTADDGRGGIASDTVTIQVTRAEIVLDDVHFELDSATLRPEAGQILDRAVTALNQNPALRLQIEGHTCDLGTGEYNLSLGERRAVAVRDYLANRGVEPSRLRTVSFGEEKPKTENTDEEHRRMNRRAILRIVEGS